MAKSIEKAVSFMEKIAKDNSHGYDQAHRNGPDYDCSSLVSKALNEGGFNVKLGSTTSTLYQQLKDEGFKEVQKPWKRGDIHLSVGHHVVMSTDANNIVHASINEKGTATGGKTGDQTGREICVRTYYEHPTGWDHHLRYEEKKKEEPKKSTDDGKYYKKYTGNSNSLVDALKAIGLNDTSVAKRLKIAKANGIKGYSGTKDQNTKMLNLLKKGKLLKP